MTSFWEPRNLYLMATIFICAFVFITTTAIVLSAPLPIGSDSYFHLLIARDIWQGNFTGAWNVAIQVNHSPYAGFLYQFLISPVAGSADPYNGLRMLEIIFLPLTFALCAYFTFKVAGSKAALVESFVLIGGWAFLDGAIQARPEALDLLLYPLILLAVVGARKKLSGALSIVTVYNHGFAAFGNVWGIALKKLREQSWRKTIIITLLIILPIIALSIYFFGGAWQQWSTFNPEENPQEALFWSYPPWIPFYAGLSLLGWFFAVKKPKTEAESLLRWGLLGNLIMLPFWADRWLQYSAIPLSMLVGIGVSRWHGKKLYVTLTALIIGAALYLMFFLIIAVTHNYWQPGEFVPFTS